MALVKIIPNSEKVTTPKAGAPVEVAFDVSNPSDAPLKIGVDTVGELKERKWAQVDGAVEVTLPPMGQQKLKVTVTLPATAEPKDYTFRLRVYDPRDTTKADESTAIVVSLPKVEKKDDKKPPPPNRLWIIIGAIVGGIIVVGGAAAVVIYLMIPAKMPDLLSKPTTLTEAKAILEKDEFQLAPAIEMASDKPPGTVIKQNPDAGQEVTKPVELTVSAITEEVPSVVSLNVPTAEQKLIAAGFKLGNRTIKSTHQSPGGTVIAQEPKAGERGLPGAAIALTVEQEQIAVPSLKGRSLVDATAELTRVGLTQGTTTTANTGAAAATVVGQTPEAGTQAEPGAPVNLLVEGAKVTVPNVVALALGDATARLVGSGFKVAAVGYDRSNRNAPMNTVKTQTPGASSQVAPGTEMSLVVYGPPIPIITHIPISVLSKVQLKMTAAGTRSVPNE